MAKYRIKIPVVVTKSGAIQTGSFYRRGDGLTKAEHDFCYDCLSDKDYDSGTAVVHVDAEIDIESIFIANNVHGVVEAATNAEQAESH